MLKVLLSFQNDKPLGLTRVIFHRVSQRYRENEILMDGQLSTTIDHVIGGLKCSNTFLAIKLFQKIT